jgi:hypothetical protein
MDKQPKLGSRPRCACIIGNGTIRQAHLYQLFISGTNDFVRGLKKVDSFDKNSTELSISLVGIKPISQLNESENVQRHRTPQQAGQTRNKNGAGRHGGRIGSG